MQKTLEGYKGSVRKYVTAYSESVFDGDHLRFTDTGSQYVNYTMDMKSGAATVTEDVIPFGQMNTLVGMVTHTFQGSEMSAETPIYQEFSPTLESGYQLKYGTVKVNVNGVEQSSTTMQEDSNYIDFYLDSTCNTIRLKKQYVVIPGTDKHNAIGKLAGITLIDLDRIDIEYQMENN